VNLTDLQCSPGASRSHHPPQGTRSLRDGLLAISKEPAVDHDVIRSQMPSHVSDHVPRNARRFTFSIYDGLPQPTMHGIHMDPDPFEGKEDCTPYVMRTPVLDKALAKLPVPTSQCPELADLIEPLEQFPAPDGFRSIAPMLVDARAKDFNLVDPHPNDIISTPPAINFTAVTAKFAANVAVLYDRAFDVYVVELRNEGELVARLDKTYFDDLGRTLERLIDYGRWQQIQIKVLSRARGQSRH